MKTKENGGNIYKMMNVWLSNCRIIFAFIKTEIKDIKRETGTKMLGEQLTSFNTINTINIFINHQRPSHTLKGRTFFFAFSLKSWLNKLPNGHIFVDSPLIRRRNSTWKICGNYIDFERRIHVEIMTSIRRGFDFQNRRNIDEFSTWIFLCRFDVKST